MLAGYVLDDEGGGDVRAKRGFLLVDGDGFWGCPVKLDRWAWMQFETFWKVWKRFSNGLSAIFFADTRRR